MTTLRADRGNKYDEDGLCIGTYQRSIVFMPREVQSDQTVRVRLIPIQDRTTGEEKKDKGGRVMYRAQLAPPKIPERCEWEVAQQAASLRKLIALPRGDGEAVLRVRHNQGVALPSGWTGYDWYYLDGNDESVVFGSRFSPAALLVLESMPTAVGSAYDELLAWLMGNTRDSGDWYHRRQAGRIREGEMPEFPETEIQAMVTRLEKGETVIADRLERR
ncbi:MAG: hypothetical protein KGJ90_03590 [Patescibacteria group bacterium]|nr:hypothetical protein [Patescibacteria group bacterium]MDE2233188.1 hypothetical protein [Patescibacteria group bacterium]